MSIVRAIWHSAILYTLISLVGWYVLGIVSFVVQDLVFRPDESVGMVLWYGITWVVFVFTAWFLGRRNARDTRPLLMCASFVLVAIVIGFVEEVDQGFYVAYCACVALGIFLVADRARRAGEIKWVRSL